MKNPLGALLALVVGSAFAQAASLSGTITDRSHKPIRGVEVRLVSVGNSVLTDSLGKWTLSGTSGTIGGAERPLTLRWDGKVLDLGAGRDGSVRIRVVDAKGSLLHRDREVLLVDGRAKVVLGPLPEGATWIQATLGGRSVSLGGLGRVAGGGDRVSERSAASTDTLRVVWSGRKVVDLPVSIKDTSGILVRFDTSTAVPWRAGVAYGFLYDVRDGQVYRTITVGPQTWMAENLNRIVDSSWWYKGLDASRPAGDSIDENLTKGTRYGRYYKWAAAMALHDSCNSVSCSHLAPGDHPGICPQGWHVPSASEMATLVGNVEKDTRVKTGNGGRALKSATGWKSNNGWDYFGFRALPNGYRPSNGRFQNAGYDGFWTTSTQGTSPNPAGTYFKSGYVWGSMETFEFGDVMKSYAHPLRCKKNN